MTSCNRYVDCAVWVEATKCAANTSDLRVFVNEDDLPDATSWFSFDSQGDQINCWSIDPSDDKVCMPSGDGIYQYTGPFPWESCADCEETDEDDGDGGPGGGGGSGGDVGGGGGGSGGGTGDWPHPDSTPEGIKVTVCAAHVTKATERGWDTANLYVATDIESSGSTIIDIQGVCVTVPSGPVVTSPANAFWIGSAGEGFDTCEECTHGVKATLCADDQLLPGADDAPEVWIRVSDLEDAGDGFEFGGWCYEVNASPSSAIPDDAFRYLPQEDVPCNTCNRGVKYALCAGENDPGVEYWADAKDIADLLVDYPLLTSVTQKIDGYCHTLDLEASTQRIPTGARQVPPRCVYASCEDCLCGGAYETGCETQVGVPLRLCPTEPASGWKDTWMPASALPPSRRHFIHNGFCVSVEPLEQTSPIPKTAEVIYTISNEFNNCWDCTGWRPPGGDGDEIFTDPPPPPPPPPEDPVDNGGTCWFKLYECDVGFVDKWVSLPCKTKIGAGKVKGVCYAVVHPGKKEKPAGHEEVRLEQVKFKNLIAGESACSLLGRYECGDLYHLRLCGGVFPASVWKNTRTDLSADVGKVISANGGTCYEVYAGDVIGFDIGPVVVEDRFEDCEECETPDCVLVDPEDNCSQCDDVTPAEYQVTFSGINPCVSCFSLEGGGGNAWNDVTFNVNLNGSFTLTQRPGNSCQWFVDLTDAFSFEVYADGEDTCTTPAVPRQTLDLRITLTKLETQWQLIAATPGAGSIVCFYDIKDALVDGADQLCSTLPSFSNDATTSGDCGADLSGAVQSAFATGGNATVVCVEAP